MNLAQKLLAKFTNTARPATAKFMAVPCDHPAASLHHIDASFMDDNLWCDRCDRTFKIDPFPIEDPEADRLIAIVQGSYHDPFR